MAMYNVEPTELVEELAKELQKIEFIKPPAWASFAKTGAHRERPPARDDWWYLRVASILRKVRLKGPIGVSKLRTLYGGKQHRGYAPERFRKGSGNIIRKILQQLEKAELLKKEEKKLHKGRIITPKGIKLMDDVAKRIAKLIEVKKEKPKEILEQKIEKKEEAKKKAPIAEKRKNGLS